MTTTRNNGRTAVTLVVLVLGMAAVASLVVLSSHGSGQPDSTSTTSSRSPTIRVSTTEGFFIDPQLCGSSCVLNVPWGELTRVYNSLGNLTTASSDVVEAKVTSQEPVDVHGVPVTLYSVTVIESLQTGSHVSAGDTFTVGEVGGTASGVTMAVKGYPLVAEGSTYIFFLAPSGGVMTDGKYTTPPDPLGSYVAAAGTGPTFVTLGGPQGLFEVQGGKVYSLDGAYPQDDSWLPVKAAGVPLAQFIQEVQSATSAAK